LTDADAEEIAGMRDKWHAVRDAAAPLTQCDLEMYAAICAAQSLCRSFDPTSGTGRTRAFLADLKGILEGGLT
jgi:hypothetical protein